MARIHKAFERVPCWAGVAFMKSANMCPRCFGFGTVVVKGRCRHCHHGYVRAAFAGVTSAESMPAPRAPLVPCPLCQGNGVTHVTVTCGKCRGMGTLRS